MQKRHPIKEGKYIIPVITIGLFLSPDMNLGSGDMMINNPFHSPEPHCEVFPHSDYYAFNREPRTASATGDSTVLTFHENNSSWHYF